MSRFAFHHPSQDPEQNLSGKRYFCAGTRRPHADQHLSPHVTNTLLKTETIPSTEGGRWACRRMVWLGHRLVLMDLRELSWRFFFGFALFFFFKKIVTFIYLCAAGGARVEIRRQLEGIDFLLPPRGFPGSSQGCQAWLQGRLSIEPSEFCPVRGLQTLMLVQALVPWDSRDLIHPNLFSQVAQFRVQICPFAF